VVTLGYSHRCRIHQRSCCGCGCLRSATMYMKAIFVNGCKVERAKSAGVSDRLLAGGESSGHFGLDFAVGT